MATTTEDRIATQRRKTAASLFRLAAGQVAAGMDADARKSAAEALDELAKVAPEGAAVK